MLTAAPTGGVAGACAPIPSPLAECKAYREGEEEAEREVVLRTSTASQLLFVYRTHRATRLQELH